MPVFAIIFVFKVDDAQPRGIAEELQKQKQKQPVCPLLSLIEARNQRQPVFDRAVIGPKITQALGLGKKLAASLCRKKYENK